MITSPLKLVLKTCLLLAASASFSSEAFPEDVSFEKASINKEHNLALSFGNGFVRSKTLETFYGSYLDKKVETQSYFSLRYHFFADTKADYSSGFSLDLFNVSSKQSKSFSFGDIKVGYEMIGLAAGWGLRQGIFVENLFLLAGVQVGLMEADIKVSTPTGDVEYKDFQSKRGLDSLVVKLLCGIRKDFWKSLGLRADVELARLATGDQLVALSAGVGYGI